MKNNFFIFLTAFLFLSFFLVKIDRINNIAKADCNSTYDACLANDYSTQEDCDAAYNGCVDYVTPDDTTNGATTVSKDELDTRCEAGDVNACTASGQIAADNPSSVDSSSSSGSPIGDNECLNDSTCVDLHGEGYVCSSARKCEQASTCDPSPSCWFYNCCQKDTSSSSTTTKSAGSSGGSAAVGEITKATSVVDAITGKTIISKVGDIILSDGSIVDSAGNKVASAGSVPNASQLVNSNNASPYSGADPTGLGGASGAATMTCGPGFNKVGGVCFPTTTGLSSAPITAILSNIFSWLMGLFTTFAVMAFVISGIQYLTSAGDEDQIGVAKRNAMHALLGVVIGLSGFVIVKAIAAAISGQSYLF
jgi:hypothetical protein